MSATAKLLGVVADGDYSNSVTVLLAEHRDGTVAAGGLDRHHFGRDRQRAQQDLVDLILDVGQHTGWYRTTRRGEVEPQPARGVERAGLRGTAAQRPTDPGVHQMRRGMRPGHRPPAGDVHLREDRCVEDNLAGDNRAPVYRQAV